MASNQQQTEQKSPEQGDGLDLNKVGIEKLRNFLESLDKKGKGTCSLALIGISSHSPTLHASRIAQPNSWILDSGTTNHMTPLSHYFITYSPCSSSRKITIADGSLTTVVGQGNAILNEYLTFKNVFHVPKLFTNLIFIQKLVLNNNCSANFYPTFYEIQGQESKKMIALAKARANLYYLEGPSV